MKIKVNMTLKIGDKTTGKSFKYLSEACKDMLEREIKNAVEESEKVTSAASPIAYQPMVEVTKVKVTAAGQREAKPKSWEIKIGKKVVFLYNPTWCCVEELKGIEAKWEEGKELTAKEWDKYILPRMDKIQGMIEKSLYREVI